MKKEIKMKNQNKGELGEGRFEKVVIGVIVTIAAIYFLGKLFGLF